MSYASDRPIKDIIWAMEEWQKCELLDDNEKEVIKALKTAAHQGLSEFERVRQIVGMQYFHFLMSAIMKARSYGLLREWRKV